MAGTTGAWSWWGAIFAKGCQFLEGLGVGSDRPGLRWMGLCVVDMLVVVLSIHPGPNPNRPSA